MSIKEEVYKITFGTDDLLVKNEDKIILSHEKNIDVILECNADINIIIKRLRKLHTAYKKELHKPSKNAFEHAIRKFLKDSSLPACELNR